MLDLQALKLAHACLASPRQIHDIFMARAAVYARKWHSAKAFQDHLEAAKVCAHAWLRPIVACHPTLLQLTALAHSHVRDREHGVQSVAHSVRLCLDLGQSYVISCFLNVWTTSRGRKWCCCGPPS